MHLDANAAEADDFFVLPGRTPAVKRVAHDFVDRYVQPGDLVAVVTTSGLADGSQPFTEDMALVKAAIDEKKPDAIFAMSTSAVKAAIMAVSHSVLIRRGTPPL